MGRLLRVFLFCLSVLSLAQCELTEMVGACFSSSSMTPIQVHSDRILYEIYDEGAGPPHGEPLYLEEYQGTFYFENDIIVGEATEFLSAQANIRERPVCGTVGRRPSTWPNGVVPYELPRDLTEKDREDILTAIEIWNEATEISFRPATPQDLDLLTFVYYYDDSEGSQCSSYLGRKGGLQEIRMSYSGCGVRILVHELGHALGLAHEHTRCDRDHYIEVLWDNILPTHHHNFHKSCRADSPFGDYDWNSVMHYNSNTFTKNGQPTLRSRKGDTIQVVVRPSEGDVAAVNYLVELSRRRN